MLKQPAFDHSLKMTVRNIVSMGVATAHWFMLPQGISFAAGRANAPFFQARREVDIANPGWWRRASMTNSVKARTFARPLRPCHVHAPLSRVSAERSPQPRSAFKLRSSPKSCRIVTAQCLGYALFW